LILLSDLKVAYKPRFDPEISKWLVPTVTNDTHAHPGTVELDRDAEVLVARIVTTDAEHEAHLRELLAGRSDEDGSLGQVTNGPGIAALLRLLDEARS
jgi:hypothetical protein